MTMTKKDYQLVADSLKQQLSEVHSNCDEDRAIYETLEVCAERLARKFSAASPNFNKERFLTAAIGRSAL